MKIRRLRVRNYKGFADSGWLDFADGFTVVVGKNNSGKTALLESFRLRNAGDRPHRSVANRIGDTGNSQSFFIFVAAMRWEEFEDIAKLGGHTIIFPNADVIPITDHDVWHDQLPSEPIELELTYVSNSGAPGPARWPSHGQFPDRPTARTQHMLQHAWHNQKWSHTGPVANEENLPELAGVAALNSVFVFAAERMHIDSSTVSMGQQLAANASNLPTLLHELQSNVARWERYKRHVTEIFPSIHAVTLPASSSDGQVTISLWQIPVASERPDLAVRLTESGTGVSQVLAILFVAMTREDNVIVIDEPNSFLHPGAARKLIEILKTYDRNQYVVSTHSPELIGAINPEIIHLVSWDGSESVVEQINAPQLADITRVLDDLGAKLSDVFGADQVIWVEGETEERCFPLIAATLDPAPPSGTAFVRMRNTGDFEGRSAPAAMIWDVYQRLTEGASLLPPALAFSFDCEGKSQTAIDDMIRRSGGRAKFLPRRELENYFLDPAAICDALRAEHALREVPFSGTPEMVKQFIAQKAATFGTRDNSQPWSSDKAWLDDCRASGLLEALFTDSTLTYNKIVHGQAILAWILANDPDQIVELKTYVAGLIGGLATPSPKPDAIA